IKIANNSPIIVMTGFEDLDMSIKTISIGVQDYIVKGNITSESIIRSIFYAIERKKISRELAQYKNNLEKIIEERSEELLLLIAKLNRSNKIMTHFLSKLSDELRSPLSFIMNTSQMLESNYFGELKVDQQKKVREIFFHGEFLLYLVDGLLDHVKIIDDNYVLTKSNFSLSDLVKSVITSIKNITNLEYVKIEENILDNINFFGDRDKIKQVFFCLLRNAVKFTSKGFIRVSLTTFGNSEIQFIVEDTGVGISEDYITKVFDDFSKTAHKEGIGISLFLAKKIVNLHNGRISVESQINFGSKFFVFLPKN
ncbi:MAG: ATP-binding protein, partial [Spirochaetota bacterium]|nr:ATP-binding protein [Spirochaetota bacterium]